MVTQVGARGGWLGGYDRAAAGAACLHLLRALGTTGAAAAGGAWILRAVGLATSWDIHVDEITYFRISESVAHTLQVKLYGEAFYLHPPAHFFLEAAYLKLVRPTGDIVQAVYAVRYLNVLLAAASAYLLFLLGRTVAGVRAGALAAGIFAIDPFVIRMNCRTLLDTSAVFWVLLGYAVLLPSVSRADGAGRERPDGGRGWPDRWRVAVTGLAFGVALLTKDMTAFLTLLPIGLCFVLGWCIPRTAAAALGATVFLTYLPYPLVVLAVGDWARFSEQKLGGAMRLAGALRIAHQPTKSLTPGGPSLVSAVVDNAYQFGPTLLVFACGVVAAAVLLAYGGAVYRLLALWVASAYALLAFTVAQGTLEEQFLYFVVVPAIAATAVAAALVGWRGARYLRPKSGHAGLRRAVAPRGALLGAATLGAAAYFAWSGAVWLHVHATPDNGYERLRAYLAAHVPPGTPIGSTTDTGEFLMEAYTTGIWGSKEQLLANRAAYVVVSSKQVQTGYGFASPDLYEWIRENGEPLFAFADRSDGRLELYRLRLPASRLPLDALRSEHPDLEEQMLTWKLLRYARAQNPLDWQAFRAHAVAITGVDVGPVAPDEFYRWDSSLMARARALGRTARDASQRDGRPNAQTPLASDVTSRA